jgi:hypothetical protein
MRADALVRVGCRSRRGDGRPDSIDSPPVVIPAGRRCAAEESLASVRVGTEHEEDRAWRFDVSVVDAQGRATRHEVRLAWADYELWSGGVRRPADVAEAVVEALTDALGAEAPPDRFDAALMRRRMEGFDNAVRRALGHEPRG